MHEIKIYNNVLFVILMMLLPVNSFTQNKEELDSLLKKADSIFIENPKEAIRIGKEIYSNSGEHPNVQVSALLFLSYGHSVLEEYTLAIEYALTAKKITENNKEYNNLVIVLTELGNLYHLLKINQKANFYLDEAEKVISKHPLNKPVQYVKGNIYSMKGNAYMDDLKNKELAISYYNKAIAEYNKSENKEITEVNMKMAYLNKGFSFTDLKMLDSAEYAFQEAHKLDVRIYDDYLKIGLAQVNLERGNYAQSLKLLDESVEVMDEFHKNKLLSTLYQTYSKIYLKENNFRQQRYYHLLYEEENHTLKTNEKKSFNNIVNQISLQGNQKLDEVNNKYFYLVILLAIAISVGLIFFFIKIRKKRTVLEKSKQVILNHLIKN